MTQFAIMFRARPYLPATGTGLAHGSTFPSCFRCEGMAGTDHYLSTAVGTPSTKLPPIMELFLKNSNSQSFGLLYSRLQGNFNYQTDKKVANMSQSRTTQRPKDVKSPLDPMVPLTRSTGSTRQVRQSQITKVVDFVQAHPGYAALDISQLTHVPVEAVNWILDCDPDANNLARDGMVARPTRGPLPLWAQQVPPELLAPANPNALTLAPTGGLAALDPSITLPFARQEGETARAYITELMRFSGGSSPTRAKRANKIVETSISLICLKLQQLNDHYEDLKEEALSIQNSLKSNVARADTAEGRAATLDELVKTLKAQVSTLRHQDAAQAAIAEILTERLSHNVTSKVGEGAGRDAESTKDRHSQL